MTHEIKYVFFDIDGTLWDRNRKIPESTARSIKKLQENGHRVFLNTGRSRANTHNEKLSALEPYGVVAACGNHVEVQGKIVYEKLLSMDLIGRIGEVLKEQHMPYIFEGRDYLYFDPEHFPRDEYARVLWGQLKGYARHLSEITGDSAINKLSADIEEETDFEEVKRRLGDELDFIDHNGIVVEMIPKGSSKAEGIRKLQEIYGIPDENIYAFGDGMNDFDMLSSVKHGIAMGGCNPALIPVAEYVTDRLEKDGIEKALQHYGLID